MERGWWEERETGTGRREGERVVREMKGGDGAEGKKESMKETDRKEEGLSLISGP